MGYQGGGVAHAGVRQGWAGLRSAAFSVLGTILLALQLACTPTAPGGLPATPDSAQSQAGVPLLSAETSAAILAKPKGQRPDPTTYMSPQAIDAHLAAFKAGASFLIPKAMLDKYGRDPLGYPDNTQFVMPSTQMDALLARAKGDIAVIERELGLPAGSWKDQQIVRISIPDPGALNLRIPSGNEMGANTLWLPGGRLSNGLLEGVVDRLRPANYQESPL